MNYFEKIAQLPLKDNPVIMGIETSCDETAVAIVKGGREILSEMSHALGREYFRGCGLPQGNGIRIRRTKGFSAGAGGLH